MGVMIVLFCCAVSGEAILAYLEHICSHRPIKQGVAFQVNVRNPKIIE